MQDNEWGVTAKKLSPGELGCTKVVEIGGGQSTCRQSFESLALGGEIEVIGFLAHLEETGQKGPTFFETVLRSATIRGLQDGSQQQFDEVGRVIESRDIKPAIDLRIFELAGLKVTYQYLWDRKQVGKVVVSIPA